MPDDPDERSHADLMSLISQILFAPLENPADLGPSHNCSLDRCITTDVDRIQMWPLHSPKLLDGHEPIVIYVGQHVHKLKILSFGDSTLLNPSILAILLQLTFISITSAKLTLRNSLTIRGLLNFS